MMNEFDARLCRAGGLK